MLSSVAIKDTHMDSHRVGGPQSPAIFTGSEVRINDPDLDNVNLAVAFRGAGWTDPDCIPLMVMQTILGTWDKNIGAGGPLRVPDHAFLLLQKLKAGSAAIHEPAFCEAMCIAHRSAVQQSM